MLTTIVIGNLGANAEFHSENGNEFVSFKVAHTDRYKDSNGQDMDETVWVSCVLNGRADKLLQYLTKGTKVCVVGDASVRTYHSKKMQRLVAGINVFVRQIELIGARPDAVPPYLFDTDGVQHNVTKYFFCQDIKNQPLFDKDGTAYTVNADGWVFPPQPQQQEGEQQSNEKSDDGATEKSDKDGTEKSDKDGTKKGDKGSTKKSKASQKSDNEIIDEV